MYGVSVNNTYMTIINRCMLDMTHYIHALNHSPKHHVLIIEMRSGSAGDEELRGVCAWTSVRHRKHSGTGVLVYEILVCMQIIMGLVNHQFIVFEKTRKEKRDGRDGVKECIFVSFTFKHCSIN